MVNEISIYRGNNRTINLTILNKSTGLPYNLTDCIITMLIKKNISDMDADAIIIKSTTDAEEGIIVIPDEGTVEFYLIPNDTDNAVKLKDNVSYPVDFEVETLDHLKYTVLRTCFTILTK